MSIKETLKIIDEMNEPKSGYEKAPPDERKRIDYALAEIEAGRSYSLLGECLNDGFLGVEPDEDPEKVLRWLKGIKKAGTPRYRLRKAIEAAAEEYKKETGVRVQGLELTRHINLAKEFEYRLKITS